MQAELVQVMEKKESYGLFHEGRALCCFRNPKDATEHAAHLLPGELVLYAAIYLLLIYPPPPEHHTNNSCLVWASHGGLT